MFGEKMSRLAAHFQKGGVYEVLLRFSALEHMAKGLLYFAEADILLWKRKVCVTNPPALAGYVYEQVSRSALGELTACSGSMPNKRVGLFEKFMDQGARCHAMRHDGRIVAYCWTFAKEYLLTFDEYRVRNIRLRLRADDVFLGNVFVAEAHRRQGVFSVLFDNVVWQWPGQTRFYSWVERTNDSSLQAHANLGFAPFLRILCVTIGGVTGYWLRSAEDQAWRYFPRAKSGTLNL